jgi:aryl-alcohol dehydrogenase-like predicted oxidoreductase
VESRHTYEEYFKERGEVVMGDVEYEWYCVNRVPVFAYGSQALGFFVKAASQGIEAVGEENRRFYESEGNMKRLEKVKEYSRQHTVPISATVLGYITCNKLPSVAIIGSKNPEQMKDSLEAADVDMNPAEADKLYYV